MKVSSAFFMGINVAASISVASQPALAQDGKSTPTLDFLKSTLVKPAPAALDAAPATSLAAYNNVKPRKVSISDERSVATRKALATQGGVKLRPFVPNRKLPSTTLASDTAVMDYSNMPKTLDGGVSEYSTYYADEASMSPRAKYSVKQQQRRNDTARIKGAAKVASSYVRQTTPRAVPGGSPAVPGAVGLPCADSAFIPPPPPAISMRTSAPPLPHARELQQQAQRAQAPVQQAQQPAPSFNQFSAAPPAMMQEPPMQPPHLSPQEQLEMNKLVENACIQQGINPNATGAAASPDLYSRVGAPPFPLSLIPEPMLKDFIKGARSKKSAIAGSNLAMGSGGGAVGMGGGIGGAAHSAPLPRAGFHSYVHGAQTTSSVGQQNFTRLPVTMPIAKQNPHPQTKSHHFVAPKKSVAQQVPVQHTEAPKPQQVMTYPPYRSQVNFGS